MPSNNAVFAFFAMDGFFTNMKLLVEFRVDDDCYFARLLGLFDGLETVFAGFVEMLLSVY